MTRLQKEYGRIFFRYAVVVDDDRIRRELRTTSRFIRVPFIRPVIEDQQRATVADKLQRDC